MNLRICRCFRNPRRSLMLARMHYYKDARNALLEEVRDLRRQLTAERHLRSIRELKDKGIQPHGQR